MDAAMQRRADVLADIHRGSVELRTLLDEINERVFGPGQPDGLRLVTAYQKIARIAGICERSVTEAIDEMVL